MDRTTTYTTVRPYDWATEPAELMRRAVESFAQDTTKQHLFLSFFCAPHDPAAWLPATCNERSATFGDVCQLSAGHLGQHSSTVPTTTPDGPEAA